MWVRGLKFVSLNKGVSTLKSHPVWVRGLKYRKMGGKERARRVAPRVGAWIEILASFVRCSRHLCRTPCGCVD